MQPWIIAVIVVAAVVLLLFFIALFAFKVAFARADKDPRLKYFDGDDFNLETQKVTTFDKKVKLFGYIYRSKEVPARDELIIFQHGMGPGQAAYTTEISYFCSLGYTVLAFDIRGCELSEGKNSKGIYSGVNCVKAAIDYARSNAELKDKKIYLIGHSWGGYSVLCASAERKVDKVVAISSPYTPVSTLYTGAASIVGKVLSAILCPFWYVINFLKYGVNGNLNPVKCVKKSGVPTLLIHGDNDSIVPLKSSAYFKVTSENAVKYLAKDKSHNPYNTVEAQKLIIELNAKLTEESSREAKQKYFEAFDFAAATEEDGEVMQKIADFLEK